MSAQAIEPENETEDGTPPADPDGKGLFDKSHYDSEELALPMVDGRGVDRIAIKVTGEVMLDRSDANDVALFRRLQYGKDLELRMAGKVVGLAAKGATSREGDLDVTVSTRTIKIDTVYVLPPEAL